MEVSKWNEKYSLLLNNDFFVRPRNLKNIFVSNLLLTEKISRNSQSLFALTPPLLHNLILFLVCSMHHAMTIPPPPLRTSLMQKLQCNFTLLYLSFCLSFFLYLFFLLLNRTYLPSHLPPTHVPFLLIRFPPPPHLLTLSFLFSAVQLYLLCFHTLGIRFPPPPFRRSWQKEKT